MEQLIEFLNVRATNENTKISYKNSIENFLWYFDIENVKKLETLQVHDLEWYFRILKEGGMTNSSVNANMRPIKSFFKWLMTRDYLEKNNMWKVEGLKETSVGEDVETFSDEEYGDMLKACQSNQERLTIRMIFEIGFRVEELSNAKYEHIRNGHITIYGKGGTKHALELNNVILTLLENEENKSGYIISRFAGKKISTVAIWKRFKTIIRRAGFTEERIKEIGHPHSGRHWYVSTLLERTGDLKLASMLARHSDVKVTQRYIHAKRGQLDKGIRTLAFIQQ